MSNKEDDILDSMSLSDDDMLDDLADDMLQEMQGSASTTQAASTQPAAPFRPNMSMTNAAPQQQMPDLGRMMSQMMPMMSQMFGNQGMRQQQQTPPTPWQDLIRQHVPLDEQQHWIDTIEGDERLLRSEQHLQQLPSGKWMSRPASRSYKEKPRTLPNVYLESDTLLASLLDEAVRSARCENSMWKEHRDDMPYDIQDSGLAHVFERELKSRFRQRVNQDEDYQQLRKEQPARVEHITSALF